MKIKILPVSQALLQGVWKARLPFFSSRRSKHSTPTFKQMWSPHQRHIDSWSWTQPSTNDLTVSADGKKESNSWILKSSLKWITSCQFLHKSHPPLTPSSLQFTKRWKKEHSLQWAPGTNNSHPIGILELILQVLNLWISRWTQRHKWAIVGLR